MLHLIALATLGTPPVCHTTAGYTTGSYIATPFIQQATGYSTAGYGHHNAAVVTAFVPVVQQAYAVEIVGSQARAEQFAAQQAQAQANLISAITGMATTLEKFRVQVQAATQTQAADLQARQPSTSPPPPVAAPGAPQAPGAAPPAPPEASATPTTGNPPAASPARLAAIQGLYRRCGSCHSGSNPSGGGFQIFADRDRLASYDLDFLRRIGKVAYRGYDLQPDGTKLTMPPGGKGFSRDEYEPIGQFIDEVEQAATLASAGAKP